MTLPEGAHTTEPMTSCDEGKLERLSESLFALSAKIKPLLSDDATHQAYERVVADFAALTEPKAQQGEEELCAIPPAGWWCSRSAGHDGPCAARKLPYEGARIAETTAQQPVADDVVEVIRRAQAMVPQHCKNWHHAAIAALNQTGAGTTEAKAQQREPIVTPSESHGGPPIPTQMPDFMKRMMG